MSELANKQFKGKIRDVTGRTRGRSIRKVVHELREYLLGWGNYFGHSELRSDFKELDSWIRSRLRSYHWKQWGRRGYQELRKQGVSRHGILLNPLTAPGSLAVLLLWPSLPGSYFDKLRVPRLYIRRSSMAKFGIRPERLQLEWVSAAEGVRFANVMKGLEKLRQTVTSQEISETIALLTHVCQPQGVYKVKVASSWHVSR